MRRRAVQQLIIPKGMLLDGEAAVIEIPKRYQKSPVVVLKRRTGERADNRAAEYFINATVESSSARRAGTSHHVYPQAAPLAPAPCAPIQVTPQQACSSYGVCPQPAPPTPSCTYPPQATSTPIDCSQSAPSCPGTPSVLSARPASGCAGAPQSCPRAPSVLSARSAMIPQSCPAVSSVLSMRPTASIPIIQNKPSPGVIPTPTYHHETYHYRTRDSPPTGMCPAIVDDDMSRRSLDEFQRAMIKYLRQNRILGRRRSHDSDSSDDSY